MILIFHITIALLSVGYATLLYLAPSKAKLNTTYGLVAVTLASGFYLVAQRPSHIVSTCMTGLIYLGIVSLGIVGAYSKLAAAASRSRKQQ